MTGLGEEGKTFCRIGSFPLSLPPSPFFPVRRSLGEGGNPFPGAVAKLNFATVSVFLIFKHIYLQLNTLLPDKSTIFAAIFTFHQTNSLSNAKKSSNARTHFCWLGITKHSAQPRGDCLPPEPPSLIWPQHPARDYERSFSLERAHTRPYTAWRKRQAALRRRVASLISGRLRGTFPLGLPECIRQTALPCVRGPDRASRLRRGAVGWLHYILEFCNIPLKFL